MLSVFTGCGDGQFDNASYTEDEYTTLAEHLNLPAENFKYLTRGPSHLKPPGTASVVPRHNGDVRRDYKATMGRVLFYDKGLSKNGTISCASCHEAEFGFGEAEANSKGFEGKRTTRNSIALGAVADFESSYGSSVSLAKFGWDEATSSLKRQSLLAITNPIEMGMTMAEVQEYVNSQPHYSILARKAYLTKELNQVDILEALEFFVNSITATETKFDQAIISVANSDPDAYFSAYSAMENLGKSLFNDNCASCHSELHSFVNVTAANNGLDIISEDPGKASHSPLATDVGVFKVPFLRNIAISGPYMHDGRFATLRQVVDHYSSGIQPHENLHDFLKNDDGSPRNMNFSSEEKLALVAYLETLTDTKSIMQEKFSNPFKR